MAGIAVVSSTGNKEDATLYSPLIEAVNFRETKAYEQSINRLAALGIPAEEANKALEQ